MIQRTDQSSRAVSQPKVMAPVVEPAIESLPQHDDLDRLMPLIANGVADMARKGILPASGGRQPAVCIDKGCGAGANSTRLTNTFVDAVARDRHVPIIACHSDRTGCDFTRLAARLWRRNDGLSDVAGSVYPMMVAGSFLDQQLPDASAHMIFSNAALHWLDLRRWSAGSASNSPGDSCGMAELARKQWNEFLSTAARELTVGGKLAVSFVGCQSPASRTEHVPLRLLQIAASQTAAAVGIPIDRMPLCIVPIYLRTRDEVLEPFLDRSPNGLPLHVDLCQLEHPECPYYSEFQRDGFVSRYAERFSRFVRGFSEPSVRDWLTQSILNADSPKTIPELLDRFYACIVRTVSESPEHWRMRRNRIVLVATRIAAS